MDYKKYLNSLFPYIFISAFFFLFSFSNGYLISYFLPEKGEIVINSLIEEISLIKDFTSIEEFFFIFISNTIVIFFIIFLGIFFGFFTSLSLLINGSIIGIVMSYFVEKGLLIPFLVGIIPHGIIEIPLLIITGSMGLKIGKASFSLLSKEKNIIKEEIILAFIFFGRIIFPFIFLSALIEVFITGNLLKAIF